MATFPLGSLVAIFVCWALVCGVARAEPQAYLQTAEAGVARAQRLWWDKRLGWYDSRLGGSTRYPLATIWDAVPLFEAVDAIDIAAPTPAHKAAVAAFARGAERYWDAKLRPTPGFAPYPADRGQVRTWFDDNGWWGVGLPRRVSRDRYGALPARWGARIYVHRGSGLEA